jgi:hypothetical protein
MPATSPFLTHAIQLTIRFIQGYRYLDRCGEALVKLENVLEKGWIPTEPTPQGGALKNDQLGMALTFNTEAMIVHQSLFISFDTFLDQACKAYDILWQTFEVKRINSPTARFILQKGFDEDAVDEAARYMLGMNLCKPGPDVGTLLGGNATALDLVLVSAEDLEWREDRVHRRRRIATSVVRQEKQVPFDQRMLARTRQLGDRQREAIRALMKLKRNMPDIAPVAAQVDLENTFETEFNAEEFDLPAFLEDSWRWSEDVRSKLPGR